MSSGSHKASAHRQSRKKPKSRRSSKRQLHASSHKAVNYSAWTRLLNDPSLHAQFSDIQAGFVCDLKNCSSQFLDVVLNALTDSFLNALNEIDLDLLNDAVDANHADGAPDYSDNPLAAVLLQLKDILPDASDDNAVQGFRSRLSEKFAGARDLLKEQFSTSAGTDASPARHDDCGNSCAQDCGPCISSQCAAARMDAVQERMRELIRNPLLCREEQITELVQELGYQLVQNAIQDYLADMPNLEDVLRDDARLQEDPELLAFIHELESPDSADDSCLDGAELDTELLASALESLLDDID